MAVNQLVPRLASRQHLDRKLHHTPTILPYNSLTISKKIVNINKRQVRMIKKTKLNIAKLLELAESNVSQWELDNIVYHDRYQNPATLVKFLSRIQELTANKAQLTISEKTELKILETLALDLDQKECEEILKNDDEMVQKRFIENLARQSALEILTNGKVDFETMNSMCKLGPEDFILTSKRTQDIINSIRELVIQGETLSSDVAGA